MTGTHKTQTQGFRKLTNWAELRAWLIKEHPNYMEDKTLILLMKSYNNHAKQLEEEGKLNTELQWML